MNKEDKTAKREEFQKLILESKESDFEKEHIYIKCPELGKDKRIKICAMTMEDWRLALAARAHHDCEPWELEHSCALDLAELGGLTTQEVAEHSGLSYTRTKEVLNKSYRKMRKKCVDNPEISEYVRTYIRST